jgi:hypothetical protein
MADMKKRWLMVLTAVLMALALREYATVRLPTDYDESVYFTAARYYADAIRNRDWIRIPKVAANYENPVLMKTVYGVVLSQFPSDGPLTDDVWAYFGGLMTLEETKESLPRIIALRQVSVGFGVLQVMFLSLLSPGAAVLLAVHTMDIKYTSIIYIEALPAAMVMASMLLFNLAVGGWDAKGTFDHRVRRKETLFWVLSAVCLGMAAASKYIYAVAGVAFLAYAVRLIFRPRPAEKYRYLLLACFGLVAAGTFAFTDSYLWPSPVVRLVRSIGYNFDYSQGEAVKNHGYPFYQALVWLSKSAPDHPWLAVPVSGNEFFFRLDTVIGILALIGLPRMWKEKRLFFVWLMTGMAFLILWPTKWPQYILIVTAPVCIAAWEGIRTLAALLAAIARAKKKGNPVFAG